MTSDGFDRLERKIEEVVENKASTKKKEEFAPLVNVLKVIKNVKEKSSYVCGGGTLCP